jgi:hypothetical protein
MKKTTTSPNVALGCLLIFLIPLFAAGLFMCGMGLKKAFAGVGQGWAIAGFGLAFSILAALFVVIARKSFTAGAKQRRAAAARPGEPWTWREDWAAVVDASDRGAAKWAWAFALLWDTVSSPVLFLVPRELARGKQACSWH